MTVTLLGKIVKSNTHIDYVCQIHGAGEIERTPEPVDYGFGRFVRMQVLDSRGEDRGSLVGLIYNTLLVNPEFGNLGPRLSPRPEMEVFAPDFLSETATLVGIIAVGWQDGEGRYFQGVPGLATMVDAPVSSLDDEELRTFHRQPDGQLRLRYIPVLLGLNAPLVPQLLLHVIDRLTDLFPERQGQLTVMRNNLAWRSIVQPAG